MKNNISEIVNRLKRVLLENDFQGGPSPWKVQGKELADRWAKNISPKNRFNIDNKIARLLTGNGTWDYDAKKIRNSERQFKNGETAQIFNYEDISMFNYAANMLAKVYNMNVGETLKLDSLANPITITPETKSNARTGLDVMFNIRANPRYWAWASKFKYNPEVDDFDRYVDYATDKLYSGEIDKILSRGGTSVPDGIMSYVFTVVGSDFREARHKANSGITSRTNPRDIDFGLKTSAPKSKTDNEFDLRDVGKSDRGEDPGHHMPKRLVKALTDAGLDQQNSVSMAEYVSHGVLDWLTKNYASKPHYIDLWKAKIDGIPTLNYIGRPEYAKIYPAANAFFAGKNPSVPQTYLAGLYKKIMSVSERLRNEYIKNNELDIKKLKARPKWQEKEKPDTTEKPEYVDNVDPDEFWANLKEDEGQNDLKDRIRKAFDDFFLTD